MSRLCDAFTDSALYAPVSLLYDDEVWNEQLISSTVRRSLDPDRVPLRPFPQAIHTSR